MKSPILITGAARSGTSMVAGVINMSGAFGGNMSGPNKHNQKGMYENQRVRNTIVKPYLTSIGVDPKGQYPLPDINTLPIPNDLKKRVERVMKDEGYREGPWMYKGAKMCLTWPMWAHAFPDAKWIIVRRRTPDIINSCFKTAFMSAFRSPQKQKAVGASSEYEGWLWWVHEHEKRFVEMIQAGLNVRQVWPERMVYGDYKDMYDTIEWLGLDWPGKTVYDFIEEKLWHVRRKMKGSK
jgi:hypothetical protein